MEKKYYNVLGLMSGSSYDGIDVSYVQTNGKILLRTDVNLNYKYSHKSISLIKKFLTNPLYYAKQKNILRNINHEITTDHVHAVNKVLNNNRIKPDLIGFHGQTVYHNYKKKQSIQLGSAKQIAELTGIDVIYNFRESDMINGGQGAPIAPIYHKFLLKNLPFKTPLCFLNIGGVSNLTYYDQKILIGFDTGPGNGLMDTYMQNNCNKNFDENGYYANLGKPNMNIIRKMLTIKFFSKKYPKSLDKLEFKKVFKLIEIENLNHYDAVATLNLLTTLTIKNSINNLPNPPNKILVSGGGVHNKVLYKSLINSYQEKIVKSNEFNFPVDYIESELMAFLAARYMNKLPSTFSSTTGVKKPTILGKKAKTKTLY